MASTNLSTVAPLTSEQVAKLLRKIVGSYPSINPMALKEYFNELATTLAEYSEPVATAGVARAMGASPEYPPPVPLIKNHCDELLASADAGQRYAQYAQEWEARSQLQLKERERREKDEEPLEHRQAVAARILAEYQARTNPSWIKPQRQTWRRFSEDDLRAIYPKRGSNDEPPPPVD